MKPPRKLTSEVWKTMINEVDTVMLDCDGKHSLMFQKANIA